MTLSKTPRDAGARARALGAGRDHRLPPVGLIGGCVRRRDDAAAVDRCDHAGRSPAAREGADRDRVGLRPQLDELAAACRLELGGRPAPSGRGSTATCARSAGSEARSRRCCSSARRRPRRTSSSASSSRRRRSSCRPSPDRSTGSLESPTTERAVGARARVAPDADRRAPGCRPTCACTLDPATFWKA